jgi:hypothetical protein
VYTSSLKIYIDQQQQALYRHIVAFLYTPDRFNVEHHQKHKQAWSENRFSLHWPERQILPIASFRTLTSAVLKLGGTLWVYFVITAEVFLCPGVPICLMSRTTLVQIS